MGLLNMVGSNANNRTIHLGVVLMASRKEADFLWVFKQLKVILDREAMKVPIFVVNNDPACIKAIEIVFPDVNILLCR